KAVGLGVAALAFACGAGLAHGLRREPAAPHAAVAPASTAAPARAEVSIRDTPKGEAGPSPGRR
ncbi:MAG TPA: hypothetical protein VF591_03330, partial [Pyrinomonadaceae bacterium]